MENTCRLCLKESPENVEELYEGCDILDKLSTSLSHYVGFSDLISMTKINILLLLI